MAETIDITALNNALKVYAAPQQRLQFNAYSFLHERLKRMAGRATLGGRTFEISLKRRGGGSWRTLQEMEGLPSAGSPAYALATVNTRTGASVFRISLQAWRASKGQERAWVDGKIDAMNDAVEQFALRCGQMWYRRGTDAAVARINGAPVIGANGGTFVVDGSMTAASNNTFGVQYLQEEMRFSVSANLAGTVAERTSNDCRITDIDEDNLTITFDGQGGNMADGDYIFLGDRDSTSKGRDWNGLLGIIDNGTIQATLHGIDRTAAGNAYWQANRLAAVAGADLENVFQRQSDTIARRNRGKISDIITTYGVRRRFANNLKGDRRLVAAAESGKYKGGFDSVQWMDGNNKTVNIWVDKDCPAQTAFLIDWSTLACATLGGEADWLDEGEGILKWIDNTLGYQGVYFLMGNLICTAPNRNAVLLGITED